MLRLVLPPATIHERGVRAEVLDEMNRLVAAVVPLTPPQWPTHRSTPIERLDLERGNRLLRRGAHLKDVAFGIALMRAARVHGVACVQRATRDLVEP